MSSVKFKLMSTSLIEMTSALLLLSLISIYFGNHKHEEHISRCD